MEQNVGSAKKAKEKNQNIQVFVRVRPMNAQELSKHTAEIIDTPGNREVVVKERPVSNLLSRPTTKTFTFDRVFGPQSKQTDVYKSVVSPLVAEVLLGYNCTVFAYGQTGTGKTFTMEGEIETGHENGPNAGIIPRALSQLFDELRLMDCEFSVRTSFLELYNEELFDLLAPIEEIKTKTLRLFEDSARKGSVIIQRLEEVIVHNKNEVYAVLERGSHQRTTAATLMNATSSRSHTIFTITVHMKESNVGGGGEELVKVGKLNLVDLAGSENIGKSGSVDKRAREAGSINQSLLTLGRVISALLERTPHVPYRESKLTRLLQDSLGGKTKTSIIATISPAASNIEETLSTLDYAHRAKNIMNRPEVNQKLTKKEVFNYYTEEIERLRKDLNAARDKNGFFMDHDNYNRIQVQVQSQHHELNEKSNKIKELEETLTNKEEDLKDIMERMSDVQLDLDAKSLILENVTQQKLKLESKVNVYQRKNDELKHLLRYHKNTEEKMSTEANVLLDTANDTVAIIDQLHGRLERKQQVEQTNWENGEEFCSNFRNGMDELINEISEMKNRHIVGISTLRDMLATRSKERRDLMDSYNSMFHSTLVRLEANHKNITNECNKALDTAKGRVENYVNEIDSGCKATSERLQSNPTSIFIKWTLQKAQETYAEIRQELLNMQLFIQEKMELVCASNEDYYQFIKDHMSSSEKVLIDLKEKWTGIIEVVSNRWKSTLEDQEKLQSRQNRSLDLVLDYITQLRLEMDNHVKEANATFESSNEEMQTTFKKIGQNTEEKAREMGNVMSKTEEVRSMAAKMQHQIVSSHQEWLTRAHDRMLRGDEAFKDAEGQLDRMKEDSVAGLSRVAALSSNMSKKLIEDLNGNEKKTRNMLDTQLEKVKSIKETTSACVKDLADGEEKCSMDLFRQLDYQCDNVSTSTATVISNLYHNAGSVDEFWEDTYLIDGRTKATPKRRKFEFPTTLSKASPSPRVLARFRGLNESQLESSSYLTGDSDTTLTENDLSFLLVQDAENKDPEKEAKGKSSSETDGQESKSSKSETPEAKPETKGDATPPKLVELEAEKPLAKMEENHEDGQEGKRAAKKARQRAKRNRGTNQKGILKTPN